MTEFVEKGSVDEIVSEVLRSLIDSGMKGAADTVASDEAFATRIFVGSNGKMLSGWYTLVDFTREGAKSMVDLRACTFGLYEFWFNEYIWYLKV